jgi:hypothetical protein
MAVTNISLDISQIERAIQGVEPSARIVSPRMLRRIIRDHLDLSSGQRAPHDFCLEIAKNELPSNLDPMILGGPLESLPDRIVLFPAPKEEDLESPGRVLTGYWRKLFHAFVDRAVKEMPNLGFQDHPQLFNATIIHEIRTVLEGEHRVLPDQDSRELFREFVAFLLEIKYFAPHLFEAYFPGFLEPDEVASLIDEKVGAKTLFDMTRPSGAEMPRQVHHEERTIEVEQARVPAAIPTDSAAPAQAIRAAEIGNDVRAAIHFRTMGRITDAEERLRHLVDRLRAPLQLTSDEVLKWYAALHPLLEPASHGAWPVASRLLYELQKACLDVERKVYAVDIVEWIASKGKNPIKRLLEKPRQINVMRRLRASAAYARRAPVSIEQRENLDALLHHAVQECIHRIWQANRPILNTVLDEVGLAPENQAEQIARNKVVEELLDVICVRGFLKMSDLRDAIARNRLKLNDLAGPMQFFAGDQLINANRKLAVEMGGVYHRGEIYLRFLQRLTSLAFATSVGRLLVLWLILPFGGAFVVLEGLHHFLGTVEDGINLITGYRATLNAVGLVGGGGAKVVIADPELGKSAITSYPAIAVVGAFLLCLFHLPVFRARVAKAIRVLFLEAIPAIYHSKLIQGIFSNALTRFVSHYLATSLVAGGILLIILRLLGVGWESTMFISCGAAALMGAVFRTPLGWGIEERMDEAVARMWRIISVNFVIGILTMILWFFQTVFELIERGMYAVDEWLRFREGDSKFSFLFKLVFGAFWFFVAYVFRFAWNLLIEPQINPIKHFPVVTVSHKLLLPMVPSLATTFGMSLPTMTTLISGVPGIFGFLVWECKENWKLYKANRSLVIGPVPVGSHGENARGLLRPGLHSGVVPKKFAKLRKAETASKHKKTAKIHHQLEHIANAIHHLAERELVAYLHGSLRWGGLPIYVQKIRLATNRLRIVLMIRQRSGEAIISIEERNGWLIGSIEKAGWLGELTPFQRAAFADALTYLYKLSGVHVLREQAAAVLWIESYRLDCDTEGLIIAPRGKGEQALIRPGDTGVMEAIGPIDGRKVPPLKTRELLLSDCPVEWQKWVERWEADRAGKAPLEPLIASYRVLPG